LHLDAVAFHARKIFVELGLDLDVVLAQLDPHKVKDGQDQRIDVDRIPLARVLPEHRANAGDDLAGAMTGVHNVRERDTRLLDVGLLRREPAQGRARPCRYSGQRLVDLVRQGRRQLTRGGDAVHVHELGQGIAHQDFRALATPMLEQQPHDQGGLNQHRDKQCGQLPAVHLP
jgi:hypothetical protein